MAAGRESWLVVGCGQKGLDWAQRQSGPTVLCLDRDTSLRGGYEVGDILTKDLRPASVDRIYADFVLNAVFPGGVNMAEIVDCPDLLLSHLFPTRVRKWYLGDRSAISQEIAGRLVDIRWMIRKEALIRMWQALKRGGELVLVDKREIVGWAKEELEELGGVVGVGEINEDDYRRSAAKSMGFYQGGWYQEAIGKLVARKM